MQSDARASHLSPRASTSASSALRLAKEKMAASFKQKLAELEAAATGPVAGLV
jgi:hypothetical protein